MDALIRSAQMAPSRRRLSEARVDRSSAPDDAVRETQRGEPRPALEAARAEIEKQVRTELTVSMQHLYEAERERGHADGYADAIDEAKAVAARELAQTQEQLRAEAQRALSAMEQAHQAALLKLESSVGEVAFAAVCQLVGHEAASRWFILGVVERTCEQLRADLAATVRLHPRDVHALRDLLSAEELRIRSLGLKVIPDDSLELGGCVLEAASGRYDGGLETQLRRLHEVLIGDVALMVKS